MKTRAAVLFGIGQKWQIEEIDLDPPKAGEVLVAWKAGGLCHSEEHFVTGDRALTDEEAAAAGMHPWFPLVGGHEGAGVVQEVGPGVSTLQPGDHVTGSFIPACGRCKYCVTGQQYLCNSAKDFFSRGQFTDGTARHHLHGEDLQVMAKLGTFGAHSVVAEASLIQIDDDIPFTSAALVSCGVSTGWGSAVERAGTKPGDVVVVVGVGGLGTAAVQGASLAGARAVVAVDPSEYRRERALGFGATHTAASMAEAAPIVTELTWGQGADRVIMTPGLLLGELLQQGLDLTGKGRTLVATAMAPMRQKEAAIDLGNLALYNKEIKGTVFGSLNPRESVPRLLGLYRRGLLNLDDMVTTYPLERINEGFQDMRDGLNVRGVVTFDS